MIAYVMLGVAASQDARPSARRAHKEQGVLNESPRSRMVPAALAG